MKRASETSATVLKVSSFMNEKEWFFINSQVKGTNKARKRKIMA